MSDIPAYVDMKRLCEETCWSDDTIRRKIASEGFPKAKPSGRWKWKEVERWMDGDRKAVAASPTGDDQVEEAKNASAAYFSTHH